MAIEKALAEVRNSGDQPVPLAVRNVPTRLMKDIGYWKVYKYAHDYENNFTQLDFLPEKLKGMKFYDPGKNRREEDVREYLKKLWGGIYEY